MYIKLDCFRIGKIVFIGATGFKASIYYGSKKAGVVSKPDACSIYDIKTDFSTSIKKHIIAITKNRKKIKIDNIEQPWTIPIFVYALIENHKLYEKIKIEQTKGKLIVRQLNSPYFEVLNMNNTPQNLATIKKNYKIEETGTSFIENYESIKKS